MWLTFFKRWNDLKEYVGLKPRTKSGVWVC